MEETSRIIHVQFVGQVTFCALAITANQISRIIFFSLENSQSAMCSVFWSRLQVYVCVSVSACVSAPQCVCVCMCAPAFQDRYQNDRTFIWSPSFCLVTK